MGTETGGMSKGKGVSWPVCLRTSSSGDLGASRTVPWCRSSNYDFTIHRLLLVCHRGDFRFCGWPHRRRTPDVKYRSNKPTSALSLGFIA